MVWYTELLHGMTNSPDQERPSSLAGSSPAEGRCASRGEQDASASPPPSVRRVRAADLLQGSQRVLLEHLGHAYVLIVTKKGGLLLNRVS